MTLRFTKVQDLRYGENPHQAAAFYRDVQDITGLAKMKQLHGKELSFNNILDLQAAVEFVKDFSGPAAVVIKHNNPTGVAVAKTLALAYSQALAVDALSAFGGIIGLNKEVDLATARKIIQSGFMECVIAPGYEPRALEILQAKKNLRLLELDFSSVASGGLDLKTVYGGLLIQEKDTRSLTDTDIKVVSKIKPTPLFWLRARRPSGLDADKHLVSKV